uniref:Uncharacterized protein n=1 Tax=Monopterus albus TaxID=43700 RepID=A0A3Q3QRI2_MONAL
MGCGNSSATSASGGTGLLTATSCALRNYGGVYVGLPADLTTVATSQSKSTRKGKHL